MPSNEERLAVLEAQVQTISNTLSGLMRDLMKAAADKTDIAQLQARVDALNHQVGQLSSDLQRVRHLA